MSRQDSSGRAAPAHRARFLAVWLLCLLQGSVASPDGPKDFRQKFKVGMEDVVVSMPVDQKHLTVARGSRAWRKGMRTVVAGQSEPTQSQVEEGKLYNETWTWYPDDMPLRSLYGGDSRAALVPFIAHRQLGDTYKWLLYGDDDTVWFMDGVLRFLEDLDPDMPYFISDHLWWSSAPGRASHPHPAAPRCLPCNYPDAYMDKSKAPFRAPKGCPCTPQLLCSTDERGIFNQFCDIPRAPVSTFSMHGGAGGIMSVGLLRAVSFDFMEMCVKSLYSTGGDAFISICMWQAGFAVTDPGYSFYHPEIQMMDPGPEDRLGIMMKLARALDANRCDERCRNMLDHMLSIHVRSRVFATLEDAAQFIKSVSMLYDAYVETKNINKLKSALTMITEAEQEAATKEADQAAGASAAQLASRQAQQQAVKQAEAQAAKEVQAAKEAATVAIQAAAATTGSARPDQSAVDQLVEQVKAVEPQLAAQ